MIQGEGDLNKLIYAQLTGANKIQVDQGPTGGPANLVDVPVYFNIPEEEVVSSSHVPGITLFYLFDHPHGNRPRGGRDYLVKTDPNDPTSPWDKHDNPLHRRFFYQMDLYTHLTETVVNLSQSLFQRLSRNYKTLVDAEGNLIPYRVEDITDNSLKINEERIHKRSVTYSFDAWVLEDPNAQGSVGPVEHIQTDVLDEDTNEQLSSTWVPSTPP